MESIELQRLYVGHCGAFKVKCHLRAVPRRAGPTSADRQAPLHPPSPGGPWAGRSGHVLPPPQLALCPSQLPFAGQELTASMRSCSGDVNHCMAHPHPFRGTPHPKLALQGPSELLQDGHLAKASDVISSATCAPRDLGEQRSCSIRCLSQNWKPGAESVVALDS